jgi:hypothetical protein
LKKAQILALVLPLLLSFAVPTFGGNLANPAAQVADARMTIGLSYYIGGADITNMEIPMTMNRVSTRIGYSPIRFFNFGADLGVAQVSVDKYTLNGNDISAFVGDYGWSFGGHAKLSSPYIANVVSAMAIGNANYFRSINRIDSDTYSYYGGTDIIAAAGLQFRIPNFGYVTLGPQLYMIMGENKGYEGPKGTFSNINNMRAWVAIDHYFPDFKEFAGNLKYYASLEFTASPKINTSLEFNPYPKINTSSKRALIQEFSISLSIGAITDRLYGVYSDVEN